MPMSTTMPTTDDEKRILFPSLFVAGYSYVLPTSIARGQPSATKPWLPHGSLWSTSNRNTNANANANAFATTRTILGERRRGRGRGGGQRQRQRRFTPDHTLRRGEWETALHLGARAAASPDSSSRGTGTGTGALGKLRTGWFRLVTGRNPNQLDDNDNDKPPWLDPSTSNWIPAWIFHLKPSVQLVATLVLYLFHTVVLTQHALPFPVQLIPNDRGNFQSIGLDSLAGMGTLAVYQYLRRKPSNFFDLEVTKSSEETTTEMEVKTPEDSSNDDTNSTVTEMVDSAVDLDPTGNTDFNYTNSSAEDEAGAEPTTPTTPPPPTTTTTTITTTTKTKTTRTTAIKASYLPDLWSAPHPRNMPWKAVWNSRYSKISSVLALGVLSRAYFFTGQVSLFWEDILYGMARHCEWMTIGMHRSLSVLLGHLSWVAMGAVILRAIPRPQPYFQEPVSQWFTSFYKQPSSSATSSSSLLSSSSSTTTPTTTKEKLGNTNTTTTTTTTSKTLTPDQLIAEESAPPSHPQWIWWVVGGYFVSSWLFNVVDLVNSYVFPLSVLEQAEESSVVAKLVNPEGQDLVASLVGFIAPCLTAPWWEEILYRGFLLPTLVLSVPKNSYWLATFLSGILFSVHHQSELAFLPLCVLGWVWAIVYTKSKNLWTTILIHSMWNSRIFLGSWFGL